MRVALWIIAICHLAMAFDTYETEDGGLTVFFGNIGYHWEGNN
jgi:hypothetical protein